MLYVSPKKGTLSATVIDPISVVRNATRLAVPLFSKGVKMRVIRSGAMTLISNSSCNFLKSLVQREDAVEMLRRPDGRSQIRGEDNKFNFDFKRGPQNEPDVWN